MPRHVPGFTTLGDAAAKVVRGLQTGSTLDEALSRSRGLTRLLLKAESAQDADARRKLVAEALRRSCELRDALDEADRAA